MLLRRGEPGDREAAESLLGPGARVRVAIRVPLTGAAGAGRDRGSRAGYGLISSVEVAGSIATIGV